MCIIYWIYYVYHVYHLYQVHHVYYRYYRYFIYFMLFIFYVFYVIYNTKSFATRLRLGHCRQHCLSPGFKGVSGAPCLHVAKQHSGSF